MKVPLDLTKVFQGILLFYVLACDSLDPRTACALDRAAAEEVADGAA